MAAGLSVLFGYIFLYCGGAELLYYNRKKHGVILPNSKEPGKS